MTIVAHLLTNSKHQGKSNTLTVKVKVLDQLHAAGGPVLSCQSDVHAAHTVQTVRSLCFVQFGSEEH